MKLAVADVETTMLAHGERPVTLFWGLAVEGEEYRRFPTTAKLWNHLCDRSDTLCIYVHHDYDIVQALVDNAPIRVHETRGGRVLRAQGPRNHEWRNSHALFPSSLAEILKANGFAKPDLDSLEERNRADTVDALASFGRIAEAYEELWGINPLGSKYLTAASCAFAAAERVAGKLTRHLGDREAYRGGRVEAFRVGDCGNARAWDINSSYPAAFLDCPPDDHLIFARVDVDYDGPCPFPALGSEERKLVFPAGTFRTAFFASSYERYIRPHGGIRSIEIEQAIPVDMRWVCEVGNLMSSAYAVRLQAKAAGNGPTAYAAKIGLNSIYGRLGMKERREIALVISSLPSADDTLTYYRLPGGKFLAFKEIRTKPAANYHYAAFVTCNARARLYDAMRKAGNVYYCDTDSMYLPAEATPAVTMGDALGEWKPEGAGRLWIHSAKDYVFGEKEVRKGGARGIQWTLKRAIGGKAASMVEKTRLTAYDKRQVLPDGTTLPLFREG